MYGNIQYAFDSKNEPVFCGIDVTRALGYENGDQAIRAHVHEKYCVTIAFQMSQSSVTELQSNETAKESNKIIFGKGIWICESGLYALLTRSKMPCAVAFQEWFFETVLPGLRPTGTNTIRTPSVLREPKNATNTKKKEKKDLSISFIWKITCRLIKLGFLLI